ncbi:hypothetical protein BH23VER1_BH23VER1_31180 [soil metagenome]
MPSLSRSTSGVPHSLAYLAKVVAQTSGETGPMDAAAAPAALRLRVRSVLRAWQADRTASSADSPRIAVARPVLKSISYWSDAPKVAYYSHRSRCESKNREKFSTIALRFYWNCSLKLPWSAFSQHKKARPRFRCGLLCASVFLRRLLVRHPERSHDLGWPAMTARLASLATPSPVRADSPGRGPRCQSVSTSPARRRRPRGRQTGRAARRRASSVRRAPPPPFRDQGALPSPVTSPSRAISAMTSGATSALGACLNFMLPPPPPR